MVFLKIDVVRNPLNCFSDYGMNNGSERFSEKKFLSFLMQKRNETFREMRGSQIHSFEQNMNRKADSLKSILSAELTQQTILELLTGHGIFVRRGFVRNQIVIRTF